MRLKLIMLDIDGVIAIHSDHGQPIIEEYRFDLIRRIIKETDGVIVLSSSWRKDDLNSTKRTLLKKGFPEDIVDSVIGITIRAHKHISREPKIHMRIPRGVEIKQWIDSNINSESGKNWKSRILGYDYNYIIIDNKQDMLIEQSDHLFLCNHKIGITDKIADKAIEFLNKEMFSRELVEAVEYPITDQKFLNRFKEHTGDILFRFKIDNKDCSPDRDFNINTDGKFELITDVLGGWLYLNKLTRR